MRVQPVSKYQLNWLRFLMLSCCQCDDDFTCFCQWIYSVIVQETFPSTIAMWCNTKTKEFEKERREFEELGHVWEFVACQEREWEKGGYCAHLLSWYQAKFVSIDFNIEALVSWGLPRIKAIINAWLNVVVDYLRVKRLIEDSNGWTYLGQRQLRLPLNCLQKNEKSNHVFLLI